ncbi:hypothetical protein DL764_001430 [Monosporascus ibericus]|uniref:Uncharacterized protein n=1 Tax=Monosporascus ibericus TaxID=155417 RepID=A0A4V1XCB4_9PEZI|nr:hypothetical protein DL764_001430 [Monosporascus ibericus]
MSDQKVWLITGCSSGFGHEIALAALNQGDIVVATARDPRKLSDLAAKGAVVEQLDVTASDASLAETVKSITSKTNGRIDILVNNAGYVLSGGVEECSRDEVKAVFETNFFGQLNVIRAVLPVMREQRGGVVANLGSIAGWYGMAGAGLYCASKACAAMVSESLGAEVAHLGIKVVCIEPGYFRTNFLAGGHRLRAQNAIEELREAIDAANGALDAYNHNQPGDPVKGAKLIVDALTSRGSCKGFELPPRLLIGTDAYGMAMGSMDSHKANMELWKDLITATDHDA